MGLLKRRVRKEYRATFSCEADSKLLALHIVSNRANIIVR